MLENFMDILNYVEQITTAHPMVTGLICFIAGLFVHYWGDIHFLEPWKHRIKAQREANKNATLQATASALAESLSGKLFSFAGVNTCIYVLDFNIESYAPQDLISREISFDDKVPDKYQLAYHEHYVNWNNLLKTGKIYDGTKVVW